MPLQQAKVSIFLFSISLHKMGILYYIQTQIGFSSPTYCHVDDQKKNQIEILTKM